MRKILAAGVACLVMCAGQAMAAQVTEVSQYGITWKFDKPVTAGQFITGDWWVVGPVTVVSISPAPGEAGVDEAAASGKSRYGAAAFKPDSRQRNGSMYQPMPGGDQGYDSRVLNYKPELSAKFPLTMAANSSLVSTISSTTTTTGKNGEPVLSTPSILGVQKFPLCSPTAQVALQTAAVLTCLPAEPPADAFRPAYSGSEKTIYREKDLQWDLLPKLAPVPATPDWKVMERVFERPWLDHIDSWLIQYTLPGENQPSYGREFARMTSIGALMMTLDAPREQKRKLLVEYVQLGIDLSGLAKNGRNWYSDGGHWQGRKWPILFASMMLNDPKIREFPEISHDKFLYGRIKLDPSAAKTTTLFQEDLDSYYGLGGDGQNVLWQIVYHTGPKPPYQEKKRADFDKGDAFVDAYMLNNLGSWIGAALAAQHMKAKAIWNHDAFFDLVDASMRPDYSANVPQWLPRGCKRGVDLFMEQMWEAHRASAPTQPGGKDQLKWVYTDGKMAGTAEKPFYSATRGMWVDNAKK